MQKEFEKIVEKAIERGNMSRQYLPDIRVISISKLEQIVNKVAEEYSHRNDDLVIGDSHRNDGWIPCSSGKMPMEHDSIFANYKGTRKWNDAMFEKISDEVNVTVADKNGNGTTTHAHTVDGKWECDLLKCNKTYKVIAWQPLPEPYQPKFKQKIANPISPEQLEQLHKNIRNI